MDWTEKTQSALPVHLEGDGQAKRIVMPHSNGVGLSLGAGGCARYPC